MPDGRRGRAGARRRLRALLEGLRHGGASLLGAEIVTADGRVRITNACSEPDLFWALKGGGGGSFGVVTRLTLATHDLPETFGLVSLTVKAASDTAFTRLIERVVGFYAEALFNPAWGEHIAVRPDSAVSVATVFQGLSQARATWRLFLDWVAADSNLALDGEPVFLAAPARMLFDPAFLKQMPGLVLADDRPGGAAGNVFWASNVGEAGQVLHGYRSAWVPAGLLAADRQAGLAAAHFAASRHRCVALHANKGLGGAPAAAIAAARDTVTNQAVLDAFALAISGASGPAGLSRDPRARARRRHGAAGGGGGRSASWSGSVRAAPMFRRPTSSSRTGRRRSGARTTPGCWR